MASDPMLDAKAHESGSVHREDADTPSQELPGTRKQVGIKRLTVIAPDAVALVGAIYFFILAGGFPEPVPSQLGPGFWPRLLCGGIGFLLVVRIGHKLFAKRSVSSGADNDSASEDGVIRWARVALVIGLIVSYLIGAMVLGFVLGTALFLAVFIYLGGKRKWYVVPMGVAGSLIFAYVFLKVVYVALPSGIGIFDQFSVWLYRIMGIY